MLLFALGKHAELTSVPVSSSMENANTSSVLQTPHARLTMIPAHKASSSLSASKLSELDFQSVKVLRRSAAGLTPGYIIPGMAAVAGIEFGGRPAASLFPDF